MWAALLLLLPCAAAKLEIPTKEIAPGVHMPMASIGTWTVATKRSDLNISAIVGSWLDLGGRGIDTAYIYFDQAEIAEVLQTRGVDRKELFITSKIPGCLGKAATRYFVEYDLKKLKTAYLDLLLIHLPGLPGPLGGCNDTWSVLEDYVGKGVLRSIGVSNWGPKQFEALKYKIRPAVNQVQFNVFTHDDATEEYCKARGINLEAWAPLGDPARTHRSVFTNPTVKTIASKHNVSAARVALRWIVQKGHLLTFLSSKREHQADDADLFSFSLEEGDMSQLDQLSRKAAEGSLLVV
mmetsp:Transcript_50571/g.151248  ORF Transcript_50571/g.151248 Transcript_50571/m.151248 type:complete len:295 (-) Transcript_50571:248-1132(-)